MPDYAPEEIEDLQNRASTAARIHKLATVLDELCEGSGRDFVKLATSELKESLGNPRMAVKHLLYGAADWFHYGN
jgi:two-component sensor histidine kinase